MAPSPAALAARPEQCEHCSAKQPNICYEQDAFGEYWVCLPCGWILNVEAIQQGPLKHRRRPAQSGEVKL